MYFSVKLQKKETVKCGFCEIVTNFILATAFLSLLMCCSNCLVPKHLTNQMKNADTHMFGLPSVPNISNTAFTV